MAAVVKRSKRYTEAAKSFNPAKVSLDKAVDAVQAFKGTKFDQSVELIFSLGIDAKQADQAIRSSVSLPHGIGKSKRVVAFCPDHLVEQAKAAGAVKAGGQALVHLNSFHAHKVGGIVYSRSNASGRRTTLGFPSVRCVNL